MENESKKDPTPYDRLRAQFKPDGKGRYKTKDAIAVAYQIDAERKTLLEKIHSLEGTIEYLKKFYRSAMAEADERVSKRK